MHLEVNDKWIYGEFSVSFLITVVICFWKCKLKDEFIQILNISQDLTACWNLDYAAKAILFLFFIFYIFKQPHTSV